MPVQIGLAVGKTFVLDTTLTYGSLDIIADGNNNILRYTAKPGQANVLETVDCAIAGEEKKNVTVSIEPVPTSSPDSVYGSAAKTLVLLFALAVLLESALAGVFRWRPFVELLNPRAVRPLVATLLAYWFVYYFDLDLVTALVNASNPASPKPVNTGGQILTALVLAGGSAGVNSILVGLGFRQVSTLQTEPRPKPDKAWIAVRAVRKPDTKGTIDVLIGREVTLANGAKEPPFVGTIRGKSGLGILSFFALDRGRFPSYGGHEVDSNQEISIVLRDSGTKENLALWGPHKLAQGAIVDLDLAI
ncbi:hypothetical protein HFN47_14945 [Rhizobium leguminosarum]|nr:hypothetical protein [Rhizobium leguminosarum]MBY5859134.1 hypothetical protein [Rhizobium leguminosarum]